MSVANVVHLRAEKDKPVQIFQNHIFHPTRQETFQLGEWLCQGLRLEASTVIFNHSLILHHHCDHRQHHSHNHQRCHLTTATILDNSMIDQSPSSPSSLLIELMETNFAIIDSITTTHTSICTPRIITRSILLHVHHPSAAHRHGLKKRGRRSWMGCGEAIPRVLQSSVGSCAVPWHLWRC